MEVVRDHADNCIIVCSIENFDPMGDSHRGLHHRGPGPDPDRQGIPDHARRLAQGAARDRGGYRRLQRPVRHQPGGRAHDHHRDEPARLPLLGPGVEGHRLSHRQGRGQAGGGLYARRADATTSPAGPPRPPSSRPSTTWSPRSRASPSRSSPRPIARLTTQMKSVGEVMAIGRTFQESLQKALRGSGDGPLRARRDRRSQPSGGAQDHPARAAPGRGRAHLLSWRTPSVPAWPARRSRP